MRSLAFPGFILRIFTGRVRVVAVSMVTIGAIVRREMAEESIEPYGSNSWDKNLLAEAPAADDGTCRSVLTPV